MLRSVKLRLSFSKLMNNDSRVLFIVEADLEF